MKIFVGRYGHEANTFSSKITEFESFKEFGRWRRGEVLLELFPGTPCYLGGILDVGNARGVAMYPSAACECAAPVLSRRCVDATMSEILEDLRAAKDGLDGICFMLHGAGCAEGIDDLESYVLQKFREIVGDEIPICVPLDLHGNITPEMTKLATLFGIKHYPHIDCRIAGALAMETCIESVRRHRSPHTVCVQLPLLISCSAGYTFDEPFTSIQTYFEEYKATHDLIDITLFHGFPFCDVPSCGASVVVVGWDDPTEHAQTLAKYIWERRGAFVAESLTPAQALDQAEASTVSGYIVINELSDNPGAGAPGDGTHLLRELLTRNLEKSIFGYIYDKQAVEEIFRHSVGEVVNFSLGGKTEPIHGEPIWIENAEILCLSNGEFILTSPIFTGIPRTIGRCARVRVKNVEIVIGSILMQSFDDRPFIVTGADPADYRYVCLKSAHHFRAFFNNRAGEIISCDPPGIACCDLATYNFQNVRRPIYPLDKNVVFPLEKTDNK